MSFSLEAGTSSSRGNDCKVFCLQVFFLFFCFAISYELIDYSAAAVYDNLIIRAGKQNEIVMEYVMF